MFGKKSPAVLIAGAGPAGLMGALCLAAHGVRVEIVEPSPDEATLRRSQRDAFTLLYPRSIELLDRHAVAEPLLAKAQRVRAMGVYSQGVRVGELSFERLARERGLRFPFAAVVAVADLEQCAVSALRREQIVVQYARRLARIEQGSQRVRATLEHLGSDSAGYATAHSELIVEKTRELDVEFLVAADGHQSVARQQLDVSYRELRPKERYQILEGPVGDGQPDEAALFFADGHNGVVWPLPGARLRCMTGPDGVAAARLVDAVPWLAGHDLSEHGQIEVSYLLAAPFGKGRIWLTGGAAHATSPLAAQSVNVGLAEAQRLGDALASVLRGEREADALAQYDRECAAEWECLTGPARRDAAGNVPAAARALGALQLAQLAPCLPACGQDFDALVAQL